MSPISGVGRHSKGYARYNVAAAVKQIGVDAPAAGVVGIPDGAIRALITTEDVSMRFTDDGTTPTATEGFPLLVGVLLDYDGDLSKFKFISTGAATDVYVNFYGV
jgi:hypothetical protein